MSWFFKTCFFCPLLFSPPASFSTLRLNSYPHWYLCYINMPLWQTESIPLVNAHKHKLSVCMCSFTHSLSNTHTHSSFTSVYRHIHTMYSSETKPIGSMWWHSGVGRSCIAPSVNHRTTCALLCFALCSSAVCACGFVGSGWKVWSCLPVHLRWLNCLSQPITGSLLDTSCVVHVKHHWLVVSPCEMYCIVKCLSHTDYYAQRVQWYWKTHYCQQ